MVWCAFRAYLAKRAARTPKLETILLTTAESSRHLKGNHREALIVFDRPSTP
jgi:hypothetical protein